MRISDWSSDVCSSDLEVADRHGAATRFQSKTGEAFEQNDRERLEIADDEGEDTDVERLLDEALDDILVGAPRPEERRDRHIDHDEGRGEEADLAAEQAENADDIAREDRQKLVDHAGDFHAAGPSVT